MGGELLVDPAVALDRERRAFWATDALEAILPLLGPVQQPLFEAADEVEKLNPS